MSVAPDPNNSISFSSPQYHRKFPSGTTAHTLDFGPNIHNPDAPKDLPVGGQIGWVRVDIAEVAQTGRFWGKKRTLVRILCLQRVGSCKTDP
jgi:hypothetical protein